MEGNCIKLSPSVSIPCNTIYYNQCDQIGRNFAIWATLGYYLLNQFSPKHLNKQFQHMFWAFKLTFSRYFDIFWPLFPAKF
jgi:hypothetical protein